MQSGDLPVTLSGVAIVAMPHFMLVTPPESLVLHTAGVLSKLPADTIVY